MIAGACAERGLEFTPHTWTNGVGLLVNLHAFAAHPDRVMLEYPFEPPGWVPEVRDRILAEPIMVRGDGTIAVPQEPGLGQIYSLLPSGERMKNYYVAESVGIATGMLITAIHHAGLVSLTYTPSPMGFLNQILGRPSNEKPYLILVVGYPANDAVVPIITKKSLEEIATFR